MGIPKPKFDKFTYADYLTWSNDERWELIDGFAYNMSPAPKRRHQKILVNLVRKFSNYLVKKKCEVYTAPFDVRFCEKNEADEEIENVVQPDISIFCDPSKLDDRGAKGAPDLVVEVLSESTALKDLHEKLLLYQRFGVKEYWITDPDKKQLNVYKLDKQGRYFLERIYLQNDIVTVGIFPDLTIDLKDVFEE